MKTLVVVMAHDAAYQVVQRHMRFWERDGDVVFLTPRDAPLPMGDLQWCSGRKGHAIEDANRRVLHGLQAFLASSYDRLAFYEYDAFSLRPIPWDKFPWERALTAPVFSDTRPERGFRGTIFCHPPLFMGRRVAEWIVKAMLEMGTNHESHFWDRYLGLVCEVYQVPTFDLLDSKMAYARNPIEGHHIGAAAELIKGGGFAVHGCKTVECLSSLEQALMCQD